MHLSINQMHSRLTASRSGPFIPYYSRSPTALVDADPPQSRKEIVASITECSNAELSSRQQPVIW